jgi:hypothetical protein
MASVPGGKYSFAAVQPVNLVLTPDGTNVPSPIAGDFNLEIFTATNGTLAAGYQGSAFAPGGKFDASGNVLAASITLGSGAFSVDDTGGDDSITAGSGNQTVVGGFGDTITGDSGPLDVIAGVGSTVLVGDNATNVTVDITKGSSLVDMGAAGGNVFADSVAGSSDTVNAGSGSTAIVFGANVTVSGIATSDTYTVQSAAGATLTGAAANVAAVGAANDTISLGAVTGATVNGLAGPELITLGAGTNIVYGGAGDTVDNGSGTTSLVGPSNESLNLSGAGAGNYTLAGASGSMSGGADSIYVGLGGIAGDTVTLGTLADATVSAVTGGNLINLGSGPSTVFGGKGDTVNAGAGTVSGVGPSTETLTLNGTAGSDYTVAGSGGSMSGGAADAYIGLGGVTADTVSLGAVTGATVQANQGGELVNLGSGPSTVFASGSDTVNAGVGSSLVQTPNGEAVTVSGASTTDTFAVHWTHNGNPVSISGTAASVNAIGAAGDTITAFGGSATVNAQAGDEVVQVAGLDTVFAGPNDSIGIGPTGSGSQLFLQADSTQSVGYGTFDSATGSSTAQATVGNAAHEFNNATDFIFYQNENVATSNQIIAHATSKTVDGVASTIITLPDGSTMTLVGLASATGLNFK